MSELIKWLSNNPLATMTLIISFGILIISVTILYIIAFFQNREISFWPPKIGQKDSRKDSKDIKINQESISKSDTSTCRVIYHPNRRAINDFGNKLCSAKKEICILQTNLTTILEFEDCFREALLKSPNLKIRILTLNPESIFQKARGYSLWGECDTGCFKEESVGSLKGFMQRAKKTNLKSEIRLYDELPSFVMFKMDSTIIIAFITSSGMGRHHSHIELSEELPGVTETFVAHFDKVWERAKPWQLAEDKIS